MADRDAIDLFSRTELDASARNKLTAIRKSLQESALLVQSYVVECRSRDLALEHLKAASMWVGDAIASNVDSDSTPTAPGRSQ